MAALRELIFKGTHVYISCFREANARCHEIRERLEKENAVGFDMEYGKIGSHLNKSALMQICPNPSIVYVFHLAPMMKDISTMGLPNHLRNLLTDEKVLKAGINIHDDIVRLNEDIENIKVGGVVELSDMAYKQHYHRFKKGNMWGLDEMVEIVLERKMPALHHLGHWGNDHLDEKHLKYSSFHAYASYLLYKALAKNSGDNCNPNIQS